MTKNVASYVRVSSEGQDADDKVSIEQQTADIALLIARNGWTLTAAFSDTERYIKTKSPNKGKRSQPSGEYDDRPGLVALLKLVKTGAVDAIVIWRDDRLMRHTRVYSAVEDALDEADRMRAGRPSVEIYDATGAKLDRFVLGIKAQIGREENKRRVERIVMGKMGTLQRGFWPAMYQRLGYATEKAERGNRIMLGPESEVSTVKDIFTWYEAGMGTRDIRRRLIAEGREQRGSFHQRARPHQWGVSGILEILRSEDYTGKATYNLGQGRPAITIEIPQIITPEQFERVQRRMKANRVNAGRNTQGVYLLQNLAICGGCGGKMGAVAKVRFYYRRLDDGSYKRYERPTDPGFSYRCILHHNFPEEPHTMPCIFDGVKLDALVWGFAAKAITGPELITEQVRNRQFELREQGDSLDSEIAQKRRKLALVEQDKMTYTRQLSRKKISEAVFDALVEEAHETEVDLREELDHLVMLRDDAARVDSALTYTQRLLLGIREWLPEINQTPEELAALSDDARRWVLQERRKIITLLCDRVIVNSDWSLTVMGLVSTSKNIDFCDSSQNEDTCHSLPKL